MQKPGKIFERVYCVGGPDITDERDCCIYLVDGGNELALIDAGLGYSGNTILNNIKKLGLNDALLKYVIVTHGHIDHIGGLHFFQNTGAKVICHELDSDAVAKGISKLTASWYYRVEYLPVPVDLVLKEKTEAITVGDLTLHCPHTPGHTPGGISPYVDVTGTRILFGQDIHGPFDASWGSNLREWKNSLEMLLNLKADILCEGHLGVYKPAAEVRQFMEYYLKTHSLNRE